MRMSLLLLTFLQLSACGAQSPNPSDRPTSSPPSSGDIAVDDTPAELPVSRRQMAIAEVRKYSGRSIYSSGGPRRLRHDVKESELEDLSDLDCVLCFEPDAETLFRRAKHPHSSLVLTGSFMPGHGEFVSTRHAFDRGRHCRTPECTAATDHPRMTHIHLQTPTADYPRDLEGEHHGDGLV
jgi:hypothetical protein